ncbi:MAG: glycosyltransferase family 4 protein, partial [Candidatus Humimicrobiaceae bacterium]
VIGSNIEGIPYIIENGKNGLIVPPKDIDALAEAIIKILTHPELAQKMGEEGYKKVIKNFTWDGQIAKTNNILRLEIK